MTHGSWTAALRMAGAAMFLGGALVIALVVLAGLWMLALYGSIPFSRTPALFVAIGATMFVAGVVLVFVTETIRQ